MEVRAPIANERPSIVTMLAKAGLPVEDLDGVELIVAVEKDQLSGVIGLELHGAMGLLRSLCVHPEGRRVGVGSKLVSATEAEAARHQLTQLFLLTQTAPQFFSSRGYRQLPRDDVPLTVRQSAQFVSLCPASAVCMAKTTL